MKPELQKELCGLYRSGNSIRALSTGYGIPKSTVYDNLNKFDVVRRNAKITNLQNRNQIAIGALVGLWAGDGSRFRDKNGKYTVKIHVSKNDKNLIEFVKFLYKKLFDKEPNLYSSNNTSNSASLKIDSKFIYYFFDEYLTYVGRKAHTIQLKHNVNKYSDNFLNGFLLGLVLSDGYLKKCFCFSTVSKGLAKNIIGTLKAFNYKNYCYLYDNRNWRPVYSIKVERNKVEKLRTFLDKILKDLKMEKYFNEIKYNTLVAS